MFKGSGSVPFFEDKTLEPTKEEQLNRKLNEAMEKNTFIETYSEVPIADCPEFHLAM